MTDFLLIVDQWVITRGSLSVSFVCPTHASRITHVLCRLNMLVRYARALRQIMITYPRLVYYPLFSSGGKVIKTSCNQLVSQMVPPRELTLQLYTIYYWEVNATAIHDNIR